VLATANSCYRFVNWNDSSTDNPRVDTATANKTFIANFTSNGSYYLNYSAGTGGTVNNSSELIACGLNGTAVLATANSCYRFVNWNDSSTDNPRVDTATANKTFIANFTSNGSYYLNYSAGTGGTVNNSSELIACGLNGTAVLATANSCYHFVNWNDSSTDNPRVDTATANKSFIANFAINGTFTLTVTAINGTITTPSSPYTASCGENVSIVAAPNSSCTFVNWSGNTETIGNPTSNSTYIIMNSSKTIVANFNCGGCGTPSTITNLAIVPETQGGIQYDAVRLMWSAPNCSGSPVDSYTVAYCSSAINDGNWASATTCSSVDYANGGTPRASGVTETCTVNGLTENTSYYFAIKSTKSGTNSLVSNSPSATALQSNLSAGDWWLWNIRANSGYDTINYKSYCYQIDYVDVADVSGGLSRYFNNTVMTVNNTSRIQCNVDHTYAAANWARARNRVVPAPVIFAATNVMWDIAMWVKNNDPTVFVRWQTLPEVFDNPLANGMVPAISYYTYNDSYAGSPNGSYRSTDGYPYSLTEKTWRQNVYNDAWAMPGGVPQEQKNYWSFDFKVAGYNTSYNVGALTTDPDGNASAYSSGMFAPGSTYDTWYLTNNKSMCSVPTGVTTNISQWWYSPEAHNAVRHIARTDYFGWEDQILMGYEARDFGRSDLFVTGWGGSWVNVSMKITNNMSDVTQNISALCCLVNQSAMTRSTATYPNNSIFKYGECVWPNISAPERTTWPQYDAIKFTGNLAPGANTTVFWNISKATSSSYQWSIWCSGLVNNSNGSSWYP
jgi:hypothetical protein